MLVQQTETVHTKDYHSKWILECMSLELYAAAVVVAVGVVVVAPWHFRS